MSDYELIVVCVILYLQAVKLLQKKAADEAEYIDLAAVVLPPLPTRYEALVSDLFIVFRCVTSARAYISVVVFAPGLFDPHDFFI